MKKVVMVAVAIMFGGFMTGVAACLLRTKALIVVILISSC